MKRYFSACFLALLVGLLAAQSLQSFGQDSWTQKRDFGDLVSGTDATARYGAVAFSINGKGYMGTGSSSAGRSTDFYEYDPNTNVWTKMDDFPGTARFYAVGFSIGNKGYVGTGDDGHGTNDFYEFDPTKGSTFQWTKIADFPAVARFGAVGFSIGAKGYVGTGHLFGTIGEPLYRINDFWELDTTYINPTTLVKGKWTQKANVGGVERAYAVGFSIGSKGYIGTGNTAGGKVNDFWEYNPVNNTWTEKQRFGNATAAYDYGKQRFSAVAFSIGSYGYIGTGDIGGTLSFMSDFWEYDPTKGILGRWTKKLSLSDSINTSPAAFSIGTKGYIGTGYYHRPSVLGKEFWEYTPSCTTPAAPIVGTITQPTCVTPSGSVELSGLPTGAWKITINYPGGDSLKSSGSTATISGLASGSTPITYTARVTNSSGCTSQASVPITINVNPAATSLGTISGLTDVCSGTTGVVYSVPAVTGFSSYNWAATGVGWAITSGQNTTNAIITIGTGPGTVTVSATNSCSGGTAQSTLNIIPGAATQAAPLSITGPENPCEGSKTQVYTIGVVAGAKTYTWSIPDAGWYILQGQGNDTVTVAFGLASVNGNISVIANNGCVNSLSSPIKAITPLPVPTITTQPANTSINFGENATFSVVATGTNLLYQWQVNSGTGFADITNVGIYSGTTTATLTISIPTLVMSGYKYRCIVSLICGSAVTSDGNATLTVPLNWAGTTSTNWDLASNWTPNVVPLGNYDVIIANTTNKPVINISAVCKNLTINSGANLTIAAGKSLTVNGTLTNNADTTGLVIKSDASGTSSLLHNTTGVKATVERYIPAAIWTNPINGWHLLSSPVANQVITGKWRLIDATNDYDFYALKESATANNWLNQKQAANNISSFIPGKGYLVAYEQTGSTPRTFTGVINTADVTLAGLTNTTTSAYPGFHLVGNPFASAINWNNGSWTITNIDANAYVWDNGGYKSTVDPSITGIIPAMNGFMVRVNSTSGGTLKIPANSRMHNAANWKSSDTDEMILLKAIDIEGGTSQTSIVRFNPLATNGFDSDYDSYFASGYAPVFYSVTSGNKLLLNTLPDLSEIQAIPFTFLKNNSDNFSIELEKSIKDVYVALEDLQTDSIQNLNTNPIYNFSSAEGDDPARFILHFLDFTEVPESINQETFTLEQRNGSITISTLKAVTAEIAVSNMLGQVILQSKTNGNTSTSFSAVNLPNGFYIVSLSSDNKVASKKIVINK